MIGGSRARGRRAGRASSILAVVAALVASLGLAWSQGLSPGGATAASSDGRGVDGPGGSGTPKRPNVVVIMTDDQTVESMRVMPQTRRLLGDAGVTFANSFVSWPLCCPSRATYLTGQYSHNHEVMGNLPPEGGYGALRGTDDTLPVWMRRAGYRTIHVGKYLNGYGEDNSPTQVPPGWSDWRATIDPTTYRMWGYDLNENGRIRTYGDFQDEDPALYQTDVLADKAARAIDRSLRRQRRRPFFLNLWLLAPHFEGKPRGDNLPPRPAPRHAGAFADEPLPRPPSFNEADVSDKPGYHGAVYGRLGDAEIAAIEERYRGELESLLAVDDAVETVIAALREAGELRNTYVLFTSDNGYFHGEHRIPKTKYFIYEPAARVPLLLRGPGIPAGQVSQELVTNVDLAPTIAEIAGAEPTRDADGRSLIRFARQPALDTDRTLLFDATKPTVPFVDTDGEGGDPTPDVNPPSGAAEIGGSGALSQKLAPAYSAVRTDRYLYVEYSSGDTELYDMQRDPYQLESRHADPAYLATKRALEAELRALEDCAGESCVREAATIPDPGGG